ncbi:coiled-coil domain-containing protein CG32809-like isoform X7 [Centruroides sculpturatus]|uniref:coiled-coil domain-containing protein CG32809-like isoform X7 n=1 Tax=Centruroides sculpturatus TaxID=218467 RepID=UPI000C6CD1A2|nr:coiled-coil domain-containing protein CG32809-like isoform X7 [Centruroides sculpturatus]
MANCKQKKQCIKFFSYFFLLSEKSRKMPFSIKRFTIRRSTSLPGGTKAVNGRKLTLTEIREQVTLPVERKEKKYEQVEDRKIMQNQTPNMTSSRSLDVSELRRLGYIELPPAPGNPDSGQEVVLRRNRLPHGMHGSAVVAVRDRQNATLPGRWRSSGGHQVTSTLTDARGVVYGDQVVGAEFRRVVVRRNGVRFQAPSGSIRHTEWTEGEAIHIKNGGRSGQSVKRTQQRRHHTIASQSTMELPKASMDLESNKSDPGRRALLKHLQRKFPQFADNIGRQCKKSKSHLPNQRSHSLYQPPPSIYDDDPGIMSEVETSATGFRRSAKARSSLPIVRTPSKTQERPLGLVFLQYLSETKRALLPNEITSMDTVKALFVRSFPKQLTMEYLDSPHIRIYIHDPAKDMFYELEDLRDIRDRSVVRIYEQDVNGGGVYSTWDQDMSYFSEPEFDSEYQSQHIHRTKTSKTPQSSSYYGALIPYTGNSNRNQTLPRGNSNRSFSPISSERQKSQTLPPPGSPFTYPRTKPYPVPPVPPERFSGFSMSPGSNQPPPKPQRSFQQAMVPLSKGVRSTPAPSGPSPAIPSTRSTQSRTLVSMGCITVTERRHEPQGAYRALPERPYSAAGTPSYQSSPERRYELPYHSSPERRTHEAGYVSSPERRPDHQRGFPGFGSSTPSSYDDSSTYYGERIYGTRSGSVTPVIDEEARMRMEYMERQLANLTGLVQKALTAPPGRKQDQIPTRDIELVKEIRHAEGEEEDSSECKAVSLQEREVRGSGSLKPAPPPKPSLLPAGAIDVRPYSTGNVKELTPELYLQLRHLRKQTKDLRVEVRNLRRMAQAQAVTARETVRETCLKIKSMLASAHVGEDQVCAERLRVSREEELYRQDVTQLEKDLSELESQVEELRGNVINRRCRVNMSDVESMALVLSRASKTVADLKARFPNLQENLKSVMTAEMEMVVKEEKFLKEEPDRLETALRRCKKLTGTLVTLKRLASVQEQRHTVSHLPPPPPLEKSSSSEGAHSDGETHVVKAIDSDPHTVIHVPPDGHQRASRAENALDALLDELQTFTKPVEQKRDVIPGLLGPQRRLPSYPSADSPVRTPTHGFAPPVPSTPKGSGQGSAFHAPTQVSGKLQVSNGSNRQSMNLSPSSSPAPNENVNSTNIQEVFVRVSVSGSKHTIVDNQESLSSPSQTTAKKVPPPPPPRTTSRSPLTSPTNPKSSVVIGEPKRDTNSAPKEISIGHLRSNSEPASMPGNEPPSRKMPPRSATKEETPSHKKGIDVLKTSAISDDALRREQLSSNSSSSESVNSQEGLQMALQGNIPGNRLERRASLGPNEGDSSKKSTPSTPPRSRQELLEQRHQELLKKQKHLQEQYARLQHLQRGQILQRFSPPRSGIGALGDLKKTGSESNILSKTAFTVTPVSGSLTHLAVTSGSATLPIKPHISQSSPKTTSAQIGQNPKSTAGSKVFETDIL